MRFKSRAHASEVLHRVFEESRSAMHMQFSFAGFGNGQILQDFDLQCRAKPLGFPDAVVPGGRLKFRE
jgi:hypothetical protein